jgi:16S rRNA (cytosine967-C5)-methyltransferase
MNSQRPPTARAIATAVFNRFNPMRNYAAPILNKLLPQTIEKQRATDLVFGTIRNRLAIDLVITKLADCPVERIPPKLLNIIRIGVYELIFNSATPEYSIINEAVENAKAIAGRKQTGFVNAVLRQITRHIQNRQISLSSVYDERTLPQTPLAGCRFDKDILPDPQESPAEYLAAAFSLPGWLIADWLAEFGAEKTQNICFASNRKPGIYARPNILKTTLQQFSEKFRQANIDYEITPDGAMLKIKSPKTVPELPGFAQGLFTVQDITASYPVNMLSPAADWRILDLCAAPGTKTTQLAELTGDKAKIIATDTDKKRLEKVTENTARLGLNSISTIEYENLQKTFDTASFDAVLLDVPCSNTGVLARRIEARYRIRPGTIKDLAKTQAELLQTAAAMLKPKGKICYSTCSIQKDENADLIKNFLRLNPAFELESELLTLPSAETFDHDGGYVAILNRNA